MGGWGDGAGGGGPKGNINGLQPVLLSSFIFGPVPVIPYITYVPSGSGPQSLRNY
jgi:hypothetical protein